MWKLSAVSVRDTLYMTLEQITYKTLRWLVSLAAVFWMSLYIFFLCSKNVCNVLNTALQVFNVVTKNRRHL